MLMAGLPSSVLIAVVTLRAELDARHVLQSQHATAGVGADHDLAELLGLDQPAARSDGVDEVLALHRRFRADLARCVLCVLRAQVHSRHR